MHSEGLAGTEAGSVSEVSHCRLPLHTRRKDAPALQTHRHTHTEAHTHTHTQIFVLAFILR